MTRGRAAKRAVNPAAFIEFLEFHTTYETTPSPVRRVKCVNYLPLSTSDNRMLRRWRSGTIEGITEPSAAAFLTRYSLELNDFTRAAGTAAYIR